MYHIEGVFHAERTPEHREWYVWTSLNSEEMHNLQGIVRVTQYSDKTCPSVYIDPRFSEDKVLHELMYLAQQHHDKGKCTCSPHYETHRNGDTDVFHFGDCPCRSKVHRKVKVVCQPDIHIGDDPVKVITYRGKLYYLEGEAGPGRVVMKEADLRKIRHKIECANFAFRKFYGETFVLTSKTMLNFLDGWNRTRDAQDMLSEILPC